MLTLLLLAATTITAPSIVEPVTDGVWVVRDDNGSWGGATTGITHQNQAPYEAKKILDLSDLPEQVWVGLDAVRLSLHFSVHDYSWHDLPEANGLDESYEVMINGNSHVYPTAGGAPVYPRGKPMRPAWHDLAIPKDELRRGVNEIVFRKAPGEKHDDYLYLGIDNSIDRGNSSVTFNGVDWTEDKLTIPGGDGEYMIRLYLITAARGFETTWNPTATPALVDPPKMIQYAGAHGAETTADGVRLAAQQSARMEWSAAALDVLEPATATVTADGPVEVTWLDEQGEPLAVTSGTGEVQLTLEAGRQSRISGLQITATGPATVRQVRLNGSRGYHPTTRPVEIAPVIAPTTPVEPPRLRATIADGKAVLETGSVQATFEIGDRLRLVSLQNPYTATDLIRDPAQALLFLVEVEGQRYGGSRDFRLEKLTGSPTGFTAELTLPQPALRAILTAGIEHEGLRLGLNLTNAGAAPVDFKLAFPHLQGLVAGDEPADDWFYFPFGGGIIRPDSTLVRKGYGDHEALYQVIDLYAPAKGGGLYVRADDEEGWHKVMALRKSAPGSSELRDTATTRHVRDEYEWDNSLADSVPGTSISYEYLRRTRAPGASFAPADAVLAGHPGDWHQALAAYSAWAHQVWKWRPYPSRLFDIHNMMAAGWSSGYLFRDGKYRTDIITPRTDCIELMSWWDWSDKGPFGSDIDELDKYLSPAEIERWKGYFSDDPVTGKKMWNNQPGDYRGYNERFGGLPAFRQAIETYRELGAELVTLYTDPFRLDDSSETGARYGREWGVVGEDGEKTTAYYVWNPCHDLLAVREWVAQEMGRVMRETGADGIRLDEYGHRGWACYDPTHEHTYAEPGITQWQKATADATRRVHEAMDEVRTDLVLTTEHPGYDYLMQYLEGCITYDLTVLSSPLRPMEMNAQRFYFPECKAYELDHRGADPQDKKKFWNAVESFGRYYPTPYYTILSENENVYASRDCTPLLVTPGKADYVYVNRFRADGKAIHHLYNASGHTFEGVALTIDPRDDRRLVDLLTGEELTAVSREDGQGADVRIYLPRDDVAVIAQLPRALEVTRGGATLRATVSQPADELVLAAADGKVLVSQPLANGVATLEFPAEAAVMVKALRDGELVDVVRLGVGG